MRRKRTIIRHETPFPIHARDQIKARYGVELTGMQWFYFGQALRSSNMTIRLSGTKQGCHFRACYFMGHWYLLVCTSDGIVKTAYPCADITEEDKQILRQDARYRRINNDEFRVWGTSPPIDIEPIKRSREKNVELPKEADELPEDVFQFAESFLNRFCDVKQI